MGKYKTDLIERMKADIEIPELVEGRLEEVYEKIRLGEVEMKQSAAKNCSKKAYMKYAVAAAILCVAATAFGILYMNPSLARDIPILGNVFASLQKMKEDSPYPEKDKTAYDKIAEHAKPVGDAGEKDNITNIAEDAGITMTVSDVYCDGFDLYFTLSLRVEDEEMKEADFLYLMWYEEGDEIPFLGGIFTVNGTEIWTDALTLRKAEEGIYVALVRARAESGRFEGRMTADMEVGGISAHRVPEKEGEEKFGYKLVKGDWRLRFDVSADTSNNRSAKPNAEGNGIIVQEVVQTPSNMHVICYVPEQWAKKNPAFVLTDGSGNRVEMETAKTGDPENGGRIQEIVFDQSQADQFTLKVYDKNAKQEEGEEMPPLIAEISFMM